MNAVTDRSHILDSWHCLAVMVFSLAAGCAANQSQLDRALLSQRPAEVDERWTHESYKVACPDMLEIFIGGKSGFFARKVVGPDGSLDLGSHGRLRVEGMTVSDACRAVANVLQLSPADVQIQVLEHASRQIFVVGQVAGQQRAVPYIGPERVIDFLKRAGGLAPGAAVNEVYVVRSNWNANDAPAVLQVDLHAILVKGNQQTNVILEPQDQVFVGETRPFTLEKCVPPWIRPLYEAIWGIGGSSRIRQARPAAQL